MYVLFFVNCSWSYTITFPVFLPLKNLSGEFLNDCKQWYLFPQETHSWPYRSSNGISFSHPSSPTPPPTSARNHLPSTHPSPYSPYRHPPPSRKYSASDAPAQPPSLKTSKYYLWGSSNSAEGWIEKRMWTGRLLKTVLCFGVYEMINKFYLHLVVWCLWAVPHKHHIWRPSLLKGEWHHVTVWQEKSMEVVTILLA